MLKNSHFLVHTAVSILFFLTCTAVTNSSRTQSDLKQIDGPVSVTYGDVYKKGEVKINLYDLSKLPSLPAGYEVLRGEAYEVTTTAIVSGPHVVHFRAGSINDENTFKKLRVFHAERDTFDPENLVWKDRTILGSAEQAGEAPNFSKRSLYASSDKLGVFVIGKLVREVQTNSATADLSVSCEAALERVTAPTPITFTLRVLNKGPDTANDIGVIDSLAGSVAFVTWEPSQGKCKEGVGSVYCKLGSLQPGESATITIKLQPDEGRGSFPQEGMSALNSAFARAQEHDPDTTNNSSTDRTIVLPDPNLPPSVTLTSPQDGAMFVGPADITLEAVASDDRGVEKVEFYDNGLLIGEGATTDGKKFVLMKSGLAFGKHRLWANVTDTGGRKNSTSGTTLVIVNGAAKINIQSPKSGSLIEPGADLILNTKVSHPSGLVTKVEVFANDEKIGEANPAGVDEFSFVWKSVQRSNYSLVVVVTDGSGIQTISSPTEVIVSKKPRVKFIRPDSGSSFDAPTNLSLSVVATQPEGEIRRIDFYANERFLGSASDIGTDRFTFTWRDVLEGNYALKAVAHDDLGATGISETLIISAKRRNKSY